MTTISQGVLATPEKYEEVKQMLSEKYDLKPGELQWKWRDNPPAFTNDVKWWEELADAMLDALVCEGGIDAWDGDGLSCAMQIVESYAKQTI